VPPASAYAFGPYRIDAEQRRLSANDEPIVLPDRQFDILKLLIVRAGQVVPKDALIDAAWKDVAVGDNSLEQAISSLRRRLGPAPDGGSYIETLARRGYRFRVPVSAAPDRQTDDELAELLVPYRTFTEGRAAVETLERGAVGRARRAFADVVTAAPDYAPGHIGLANALALAFEATRVTDAPDLAALETAARHAQEACRLAPDSAEAWATLAFVRSRAGSIDGIAAARRAIALEPDNWRHHVRLAYASWGEERLRAARQGVGLLPGLGLAHWLAASVHVARRAFDAAIRELRMGTDAHRPHDGERFGAVGLHLLLGLIALAQRDPATAERELERELERETAGHIYTHQACAAAWCAMGALHLEQARTGDAVAAFDRALELVPGHLTALAAMSVAANANARTNARSRLDSRLAGLRHRGALVDAAIGEAVVDALSGRSQGAPARLAAALREAPAGTSAGWTIPIEPLLRIQHAPEAWEEVLRVVANRAA
jgi:DNA-binding winged helix-turn-helix (wHTH) protein